MEAACFAHLPPPPLGQLQALQVDLALVVVDVSAAVPVDAQCCWGSGIYRL